MSVWTYVPKLFQEELAYENPSDFQDINLLKPEEI